MRSSILLTPQALQSDHGEQAAEVHDFVKQDLSKLYPNLVKFCSITVYDVAPAVLNAFDDKLVQYAIKTFKRGGIQIKTSRHIQSLSPGLPGMAASEHGRRPGLTLNIEGEGQIGVGMAIWSTGLMANPFIASALNEVRKYPVNEVVHKADVEHASQAKWTIVRDKKTGSVVTNDRLRLILQTETSHGGDSIRAAYMRDVFAIGDCAQVEGITLPATAQVRLSPVVMSARCQLTYRPGRLAEGSLAGEATEQGRHPERALPLSQPGHHGISG